MERSLSAQNGLNAFVEPLGMAEIANDLLVGEWLRKSMKEDGVMQVINVVVPMNMKVIIVTKLSSVEMMVNLSMEGLFQGIPDRIPQMYSLQLKDECSTIRPILLIYHFSTSSRICSCHMQISL
ncbi:unnamed protein product [Onchocerca flexuosa]|uniref:START domain-containing protein n=1 Tax=Onchocerca flexuosa TaxID=387005 RepID=A0A183HU89_9BILA|nr:unnamed protein product [Onchocerca flexuosa]